MDCKRGEYYDHVISMCQDCNVVCCHRGIPALTQCYQVCEEYFTHCVRLTPPDSTVFRVSNSSWDHNATRASCVEPCDLNSISVSTAIPRDDSITTITSDGGNGTLNGTLNNEDSVTAVIPPDRLVVFNLLSIISFLLAVLIVLLVFILIMRRRNMKSNPNTHVQLSQTPLNTSELEVLCEPPHERSDSRSNHPYSEQNEYRGPLAECRKPETAHGDTEHATVMPEDRPAAVKSEPVIPKDAGNSHAQPDTPQAEGDQEETPPKFFLSHSQGDHEETLPKQSYTEPKKKILPLLDARTEQPKPNYDENETPLKTLQQPSNTVQQPQDTVQQPSNTVQLPSNTVQQPFNSGQQPLNTVLQQSNTLQQPPDTEQQPSNSVKQPLSVDQTLLLVKTPQAVHTPPRVAEDEAEETPLKRPVNDAQVHNPDMRQQRQAGRQLSEECRNPTEPETQHYQEEVLRELSIPAAKPQEQRHLMSITDSLMPEEWEPAATKLDKFEVTFVLDKLLWVKQYMLDEDKINVYVDFDHFRNLTYIIIIAILKKLTLWDEIDFRVREMLPSDFTLFGSSQMVLSPGAEINVNNSNGRHAAIGTYLHCHENGKYYAITAGHLFSEGDACYRLGQLIGKCVFSWSSYTPPRTIDLALIELSTTAGKLELQNYIHSASAVECLLKLPETEEEVCAMECWKVQRKSRDRWQYGFLRYAVLTNKDHGLYRVVGIMRTVPQNPVVTEGDCGCLVTSLPRTGGELIVYGMFVGRLTQEADDGAEEPVEWYVAFPLKQALEMVISNGMFRGKTLNIVSRTDSGWK